MKRVGKSRKIDLFCLLVIFCISVMPGICRKIFFSGIHIFTFVILAFKFIHVTGRDFTFNRLTINQGLSQNSVYCILKDTKGFLWFGTEDGLNRFDGYHFKIFNTLKDKKFSINSNYAYAICEIDTGIFVIGTEKGYSVFESKSEKFVNVSGINSVSYSVSKIVRDSLGNVWIGTFGDGVLYFRYGTGQYEALKNGSPDKQLFKNEIIYDILPMHKNELWIGRAKGLGKVIHDYQKTVETYMGDFPEIKVRALCMANSEEIWIGSEKGLFLYHTANHQKKQFAFTKPEIQGGLNSVKAIGLDKNGNVWVGTDDGLVILDTATGNYTICQASVSNPDGLSNNLVQAIFVDNCGIVWIGTDAGGVNFYDIKSRKFKTIKPLFERDDWLNNKIVYGFAEGRNGLIYIATFGGGVNVFDPVSLSFKVLKASPGKANALQSNYIYTLASGKDGIIWIGTRDAGIHSYNPATGRFHQYKNIPDDPESLSHNAVKSILVDSKNRIWIGTYGGGLNLLNPATGKIKRIGGFDRLGNDEKTNIVYSIYEDKSHNIWMGTRGGGLKKLDQSTFDFESFMNIPDDTSSLSNNFAYPVFEDSRHRFWIGTLGGGLNLFDRINDHFISYTKEDGLSNNVIYGILEDKSGNLWLSTAKGLTSFNPDTKVTRCYYEDDGLQSSEFNGGAAFKASNGFMYFGGISGFSYFHPDSIFFNNDVPPVVITSLKILNREVFPSPDGILKTSIQDTRAVTLLYSENIISFGFTALNYTHPEMNQYACKMEGFDKQWIELGTQRNISYTNLDPGEYIFRVVASNNDGIWNRDGVRLAIIIEPPFYKTIWFKIMVVLVIVSGILLYIRRREYNLLQEKKRLETAVRERTREIEMQKEEIESQRDEIQKQAFNLQEANRIIDQKNRNITDSIKYASYIQNAVLPDQETLRKVFHDSFVLYQPRDIVSGDFYWIFDAGEQLIFAVADCTGHGVPGALMSMMGIALLNEIVNFRTISDPCEILEELRTKIKLVLRQSGYFTEMREGIEIALIFYHKTRFEMIYSGANIPLLMIRNGNIIEFEPDYQPAGISLNEKPFASHCVKPEKGDVFYIMSDGYVSQFGGNKGQQFRKKRLHDLLLNIHHLPFSEQKQSLLNEIELWKGNLEQIDDILILGFTI